MISRLSSGLRRCLAIRVLLLFLGFGAGATAVHAASAVLTATNFPPAVSNTYDGIITLQINGLTNGVTNVVVQKFLDVNTNGVIDSGDLLVQQFQLAVGQAPSFTNGTTVVTATNFMPGDMTLATTGQITAPFNFQNGDFMQSFSGQYIYRISSPSGQFSSITQIFHVTNALTSSVITGTVQYESTNSMAESNCVVLLCVTQNGSFDYIQSGTVADKFGNFTFSAPPNLAGQEYILAASRSNYVADLSSEPEFTLYAKQTNSGETVYLAPASTNITGRVVNAANGNGLAGISSLVVTTNSLPILSLYFTDTNGNFYAPVTGSNDWVAPVEPFAAAFRGYLTWQSNLLLIVTNKSVGLTNSLPEATAIFYGTVSNSSANPMPGVYLYAADNTGRQSSGMTDKNGKYVVGVVGGANQWQFAILPPASNPGLTNSSGYVFSPGYIQTNLNTGQAVQVNYSLSSAPYTISGSVLDVDGNPISGVQMSATSGSYQAFTTATASDGTYTLNVSPGVWTVGVSTNSLASLGYTNYPSSQTVDIVGSDASDINFQILVCGEIQVLTTNLLNAMVGSPYSTALQATSCGNISGWSTAFGITLTSLIDQTNITYPPGTVIYSDGKKIGYLESYFSFGLNHVGSTYTPFLNNINGTAVGDRGNPNIEDFENLTITVNLTGPINGTNNISVQFGGQGTTWSAQPTTQNGSIYSTVLSNGLYQMYYTDAPYVVTNGALITRSSGTSNNVALLDGQFHSITTAGNSLNLPSSIPYTGTNGAPVWIKTGTNQPGQYLITAYGPQTTNLPPGLTLYPDGTISGTPTSLGTNNGTFNFTVSVTDSAANTTVQPLSLLVYPATIISIPTTPSTGSSLLSSNLFQMQVNGVIAGQNYTLLMNTNLLSTNWVTIFTTNAPDTNALILVDPNATNPAQFYRVLLSP